MLCGIKFLEKSVSEAQWNRVIGELRSRLKCFVLLVNVKYDKVLFYLVSKRSPLSLNSTLHPIQVEEAPDTDFPGNASQRFGIVSGNFMDQYMKHSTDDLQQHCELWVQISFGMLSRLHPVFRTMRMIVKTSRGWENITSLRPVHVARFLEFDFSKSAQHSLDVVKPKLKTAIAQELPIDSTGSLSLQGSSDQFINLSKIDYHRHTLIVGQSGSGKSELLRLATEEHYFRSITANQGVVIIDPHGKSYERLSQDIPCFEINPLKQQIQFFEGNTNALAASELTVDLIESQLSREGGLDMRGKRVLKFVLFALYSSQSMSYDNIVRFINDPEFRMRILSQINTKVVIDFFETEFLELRNRFYDVAILPILNIIGEYQLSVSTGPQISFLEAFQKHRVIVISIPQGLMGSKLTRLYGATMVQQLFLYAQAGLLNCPFTVMIDELPLIYTPSFNRILAEARKFGLGFWFVQQYLQQIPPDGLSSIFANTSNYFCFKTNVDDAQLLASNLNLEVESFVDDNARRTHTELARGTLLDLSRGQVVARLMVEGRYLPATRLNTDINAWTQFAKPRSSPHAKPI